MTKDIEREAFEAYMAEKYKNLMDRRQCLNNGGGYMAWDMNVAWQAWQAATAQVVPDTYTPIVLALEDVQSKIAKTSFLTMDEENENEVMAVNANELAAYIDELIEAQGPDND